MSRFNTLYLGSAERVADELESETETTVDDLRVALINAMGMITKLQQEVTELRGLVTPVTR